MTPEDYAFTVAWWDRLLADDARMVAWLQKLHGTEFSGYQDNRDAAAKWVSGEDRRIAPSVAKLFCTEMVGEVADKAVQVHGGSGYMREMPVERIYRDVRLLRLYEGTSEIQRLVMSRAITGLPLK